MVMEMFCVVIVLMSISWLQYCDTLLQDVTIRENWAKRYIGPLHVISIDSLQVNL
jgi:general stress protein CsbA